MRVYSWNMLFNNRELDRAFEFVSKSDFDIFCLQEVPETFLARLKTLPWYSADAIDVERLVLHTQPLYLTILSRHPITRHGSIPFPDYWPSLPWRTRFFVRCMRRFHFTKIRNRNGMYVDITVNGLSMRIFNLHLVLAHPTWRLKEFELAMVERDAARPTIVCGDFNILEAPQVTPLNWILGGRVRDALLPMSERTRIEKRFGEHTLSNPLRGKKTHSFAGSQLDHILVSHSFSIKNATVLPDRFGSDHHPICVEVA